MPERQVLRGFLMSTDVRPPLVVVFGFNPDAMRDSKSVNYHPQRTGTVYSPGRVYTGGGDRTITFTLHLHGLEMGHNPAAAGPEDNGVAIDLATLRSFLYPHDDPWAAVARAGQTVTTTGKTVTMAGQTVHQPPVCVFGFGTRLLRCWVTDLEITEQQFNSRLTPVRAEVVVTLVVVEDESDALQRLDVRRRKALAALSTGGVAAAAGRWS